MSALLEQVTHTSVLAFYVVTFVMALIAHRASKLWARRIVAVAIMCITAFWIFFYIVVVEIWDLAIDEAHTAVLWSRIGHYITSTSLFVVAFVIRRSEKYGLSEMFMTDEDI